MINKFVPVLILLLTGTVACRDQLNTLDGPSSGEVGGFACNDLPMLTAANEMPASRPSLVSQGLCIEIRNRQQVEVIRTVMMPGDGRYSQFELLHNGRMLKLWVRTSAIRTG